MKKLIGNISIVLGCFLLSFNVKGQGADCYIYNTIPLYVGSNMCTKQWVLSVNAVTYEPLTPYCSILFECYQYALHKDNTLISKVFTTQTSHTFYVDYNKPGNYSVEIVRLYQTQTPNHCNNGYSTIVVDLSNTVSLTHFCVPSITFSNVNSGAGTLSLYSRTRDYVQTQNNVTVSTNTDVVFYSQGTVVLNPGFSTENNSNFLATIVPCNSTATSCPSRIAIDNNVSGTLPVSENNVQADVNVYPNPATSFVNIRTGEYNQLVGMVEIYSLLGDKLMTLTNNDIIKEFYEVKTDHLSGMYILKISVPNNKKGGASKLFIVNNN